MTCALVYKGYVFLLSFHDRDLVFMEVKQPIIMREGILYQTLTYLRGASLSPTKYEMQVNLTTVI